MLASICADVADTYLCCTCLCTLELVDTVLALNSADKGEWGNEALAFALWVMFTLGGCSTH